MRKLIPALMLVFIALAALGPLSVSAQSPTPTTAPTYEIYRYESGTTTIDIAPGQNTAPVTVNMTLCPNNERVAAAVVRTTDNINSSFSYASAAPWINFGGVNQSIAWMDHASTWPKYSLIAPMANGVPSLQHAGQWYDDYAAALFPEVSSWFTVENMADYWQYAPGYNGQLSSISIETYYIDAASSLTFDVSAACIREVQAPTATPTPEPPTPCETASIVNLIDLVDLGAVSNGSLQAVDIADVPVPVDRIDVTLTYDIPAVTGNPGDYFIQGTLSYGLLNGGSQLDPATIWVNGSEYSGEAMRDIEVGIWAGTTTLTVRFALNISGDGADQALNALAELAFLRLSIPTANGGQQLLCDGDMENNPESQGTDWNSAREDLIFGRLGIGLLAFINDIPEGGPSCGDGYQVIGRHPYILNGYVSPPIDQPFVWGGGTMYWKFRYRSRDLFGWYPASPNVYLVDETGAFVMDLYGTNVYEPALSVKDWTLMRGGTALAAGTYSIVLELGYDGTLEVANPVYYDDVAVGIYPQPESCTTSQQDVPLAATATITNTPPAESPTPTPTRTGTLIAGTLQPSRTATATRAGSTTPRASYTPRPTVTRSSGTLTAIAPTASKTAFGGQATGTPSYLGTGTPDPNQTATGVPDMGDPNNTWWPLAPWGYNPGAPWTGPGTNPGTPQWTGNPQLDCARPAAWEFLFVNKWIDYETCSFVSFISFGTVQQATAQAIPAKFNNYEPFGTINELSAGVKQLRTQVARYPWNNTGVAGVNDSINPLSFLKAPGAPDAWATGAEPFDFSPNSAQSGSVVQGQDYFAPSDAEVASPALNAEPYDPYNTYGGYCNTKLSSLFSGNLAKGACYALGFARTVGLLPWVQFFINIACLVTMVTSITSFFVQTAPSLAAVAVMPDMKE